MAHLPGLDARSFVKVAQDLMIQPDLAATYERVVSLAVELTGCASATLGAVRSAAESETAIRSEACYPLQLEGWDFGVLSLCSEQDGYFDDDVRAVAEVYAGHALMALIHAHERNRAANLEVGLAGNREIGMAIGVLMTAQRITDQQAFNLLRTASQHGHLKLRDLAAEVVLTGRLPLSTPTPASSRRAPRHMHSVVA